MVGIGQVEDGLDDLRLEDVVLLPQVQHSDDATLVLGGAAEEIGKRLWKVALEARGKNVLLGAVLVAGLADDRVDDIQARYLVLRLALEDELLHALHDMLVELDGAHRRLGDRSHLGLGYGRPAVIESGELQGKIEFVHGSGDARGCAAAEATLVGPRQVKL